MIYSSTVGGGAMGMVKIPRKALSLSKTFLYSNKKGTRYKVSSIKADISGWRQAS